MRQPTAEQQLAADLIEEQRLGLYKWLRDKHADDLEPIFDVRPSSRGGAEWAGGRSLLHEVAVDVLVLAWFVGTELVSRARRWSPRGTRE